MQFDYLKIKYLALIPFLTLSLIIREIKADVLNIEKINENISDDSVILKKFNQTNGRELFQSKFNNFINLLAENIIPDKA